MHFNRLLTIAYFLAVINNLPLGDKWLTISPGNLHVECIG